LYEGEAAAKASRENRQMRISGSVIAFLLATVMISGCVDDQNSESPERASRAQVTEDDASDSQTDPTPVGASVGDSESTPEPAEPEQPESEGTPTLTEAQVAAYINRAAFFAEEPSRNHPDLDWREVLAGWLAEQEPQWSQGFEELVIRDFFADRKAGFFVDVGCFLPREGSTTCYLEEELQWTGIGIDVIAEYGKTWGKHRPKTKFLAYAVSDVDGEKMSLHIGGIIASLDRETVDSFIEERGKTWDVREIEVTTMTLNTLLEQNDVEKVDFLSIDIEGAEPAALKGFDIQRYKPDLCCVEGRKRSEVMEYFVSNGYELIEKYQKADKVNLYFRPKPPE
jgi:FkbM family methyltransferase